MAQPMSLSALLEESKRLTTHLTSAEIPTVQRGIDLLESESRKLVARSIRDGRPLDPRGQALLSSAGVDTDRLAANSASAALLSAFEMLQPTYDANVASFLSQQQEQSIINAIEESELTTLDDFDRNMAAHMNQVWEDTQRRLFEELGQFQGAADATAAFVSSGGAYGLPAPTMRVAATTHPRVERYAQVVRDLNDARVPAAVRSVAPQFNLLAGLEKATSASSLELKSKQIAQTWRLLAHYSGGADSVVAGACAYLEETFVEHVDRIVAQYPQDANVGGIPSVHRKIQGYLRVLFGRLGRVPAFLEVFNDDAIWAHMYTLYRCGYKQDLLRYALEMEDIITDSDPGFVAYLKAFVDGSLGRASAGSDIHVAPSSLEDPYKAALYKVIGRGNVPKKATAEAIQTTEDYMWASLVQIRDANALAAAGHPRSTLDALQVLMVKYGPTHFDPSGNSPLLYLRVLLLCGLFENAVEYLLQIDRFQIEAVHMAVLLAYFGLIQAPSAVYSRTVVQYARALADDGSDESAVHYLLLLTLPSAESHDECVRAIVRVLYERRDYARFLGDIQADGTRRRGFLEHYLPLLGISTPEQFAQTVVRKLADRSRDEGRLADAVLLYNLGERYNTVLNVLCRQLGEALYQSGSEAIAEVEGVAHAVLEHYQQREHIARVLDERAVSTCATLLAVTEFIAAHTRGAYEEALELIASTQLLPLDGDVAAAAQHAERVRTLDDSITRNFSLVLLTAMDTLSRLYSGLRESPFLDAIKQTKMQDLRRKARGLMVFAGMVHFRMPPETYAKLNRLDVFMN
ncbi:nuclear pore complex subunit [Coemansia sp. RSA 2559]|nr:nuclear pore complex subunit [Coemansia sp. RSA 2559]KAJ2867422.1 nuclear pore complex subunit [Coemansia erecta]